MKGRIERVLEVRTLISAINIRLSACLNAKVDRIVVAVLWYYGYAYISVIL